MKLGAIDLDNDKLRLGLFALALAIFGAVLGLRYAPGGPTLAFVAATLAALGTRAGVALGALALLAGLGTRPIESPILFMQAAGLLLSGLGLGLLARELDRLRHALSPWLAAAALAFVAALTLAIPETRVLLASPEGQVLTLPALVVDGASFTRMAVALPAEIPLATPGGPLVPIAFVASLVAALGLLVTHLRGVAPGAGKGTWKLAAVAALLATFAGLLGLFQLFGSVELQPEPLRRALSLASSRDAVLIDLVVPPAADLALWSRPWVDGLRLLPAIALLVFAIRRVQDRPRPKPQELALPTPWLLAAFSLTALGAALFATSHGLHGAPIALVAGLVLGLGGLIAGRTSPTSFGGHDAHPLPLQVAPVLALLGGALLWVYAWVVAPLFGA